MLIRTTYSSIRSEGFSADEIVRAIAIPGRRRNSAAGITTCLWFGPGSFVQVLEGEREAVEALMGSIRRDPRHSDIRILSRSTAVVRLFDGWPFKLVSPVQCPGIAERAEMLRAEDWIARGNAEPGRAEAGAMEAAVKQKAGRAEQKGEDADKVGDWADLSDQIVIRPGPIVALSLRPEARDDAGAGGRGALDGQASAGQRSRHAAAVVGLLSELAAGEPIIYP